MSETHHGHALYHRLVATVYWMDAPPSMEVFFVEEEAKSVLLNLTADTITKLETGLVALLNQIESTSRALQAIYVTHSTVGLTPDDIAASTAVNRIISASFT
jgi:predicted ATP-grasp superfamily ATP-dependent carboligase